MKRVMIIGQPGSGKSTLARFLGERTGLPVVHIDKIHWKPGWNEREKEEKTALCQAVHARDRWIFEGGHSVTWEERRARCDTLIWLDFPLWLRVWRVVWRTLRIGTRAISRSPNGSNPSGLDRTPATSKRRCKMPGRSRTVAPGLKQRCKNAASS